MSGFKNDKGMVAINNTQTSRGIIGGNSFSKFMFMENMTNREINV